MGESGPQPTPVIRRPLWLVGLLNVIARGHRSVAVCPDDKQLLSISLSLGRGRSACPPLLYSGAMGLRSFLTTRRETLGVSESQVSPLLRILLPGCVVACLAAVNVACVHTVFG